MTKERLIVFTRYPQPGQTKTRLIPTLGAQGAADLQRQMTEHTLSQVRKLLNWRLVCVEVRYDGGTLTLMRDWLGHDLIYQPQGEGDLGSRLARAHRAAVAAGMERVVIIGTDCPDLNAHLLVQAFYHLQQPCDLVLGPAIDGGYYSIGLNRFILELFVGINWGTATVLQQTVDIANKLNLSVAYLVPLADIDRPEDLPIWEQRRYY